MNVADVVILAVASPIVLFVLGDALQELWDIFLG